MDRTHPRISTRRSGRLLAIVAVTVLTGSYTVASMAPAVAAGTTRYVALTGGDTNDCHDPANPCRHVRYALDQANAGDTISVAAGTYPESLTVRQSETIIGAGAGQTTISGAGTGNPSVDVDGTISTTTPDVTLSNLGVSGNPDTHGVVVVAANVTIIDSQVSNNASDGISLSGSGDLEVSDSDVGNNGESGIEVSAGSATVTRSLIDHNAFGGIVASGSGTSVAVNQSTLDRNVGAGLVAEDTASGVVTNSTLSNTGPFTGTAEPYGGGVIVLTDGAMNVSESTVAANTNTGVLAVGAGAVQIHNSTVTGTHPGTAPTSYSGGLVSSAAAGFTVTGTIDAANGVPDCSGTITDGGYNLQSDGSCHYSATGSVSTLSPQLGPLADHGGPTQTVLPGFTSPARNAIPLGAAGCVTGATDQRGKPRPDAVTHRCDIGSVEAQVRNPTLTAKVAATHGKHHGWYRGRVSVTFHCTIGSAPLATSCPSTIHTRKSGKHHLTRTIHALDGGRASVSKRFKVDNTKPRIRVFLKHRAAHVKCRDSFSGLASCHVRSRRVGSTLSYVATAHDKAGNVRHKKGKLSLD